MCGYFRGATRVLGRLGCNARLDVDNDHRMSVAQLF